MNEKIRILNACGWERNQNVVFLRLSFEEKLKKFEQENLIYVVLVF